MKGNEQAILKENHQNPLSPFIRDLVSNAVNYSMLI